MRRLRLGSALAGALGCLALSVAVCAALWPHAREAGAILAAQDDPAALSDIHINSALRSNQALIADNIEAALAVGDSDLANSFVELARDRALPSATNCRSASAMRVPTWFGVAFRQTFATVW